MRAGCETSSRFPRLIALRSPRFMAALLCAWLLMSGRCAQAAGEVQVTSASVRVGNTSFRCNVVTLDLSSGKIQARVATARQGIGRTEPFSTLMRAENNVVAAINGTFFDAYNATGDKDPNMTLIHNGQVIHKGATGTVIGFAPGAAFMGHIDMPIRGTIEVPHKRPDFWYAYWINRTPQSADNITIFTPARGARTRVSNGTSIIVERTRVVDVVHGDAPIPPFGYVINLRGGEEAEAKKFPIGAQVGFSIEIKSEREQVGWQLVREALGAGPRLLTDGNITLNADGEGFRDPKVLSDRGQRSAIGILRGGKVILVTVGGPTCAELAQIMKRLGCLQAMNLDGGASSALYANGQMLTSPGRDLSNALLFVKSK